MHIIRKLVFDIKNVESGNWGVQKCGKWKLGGQKMLKVEIEHIPPALNIFQYIPIYYDTNI